MCNHIFRPIVKRIMRKEIVILIFFVSLFILIRNIHFPLYLTFSTDQAVFSIKSQEIFREKSPTLIGPPSSLSFEGREIFQGPAIYYFHLIFLTLGNFNPITASYIFMLFAAVMTIPLYFGVKFLVNKSAAIVIVTLYSLLPFYINYTRFLWNSTYEFVLLTGLIFLMGIFRVRRKAWYFFSIALYTGLLTQFHYQFILIAIGILIFYLLTQERKYYFGAIFITGFILGFFPIILFELRHNFYNFRTLVLFSQNLGALSESSNIYMPHYFLTFSLFLFIFLTYLLRNRINLKVILFLFLFLLVTSLAIYPPKPNHGFRMPEDLTIVELIKISKLITNDVNGDSFNIASNLDGDSRAMPYRYLVEIFGKKPQDVENYNKVDSLYVITRDPARVVQENTLFEIASFQPSVISKVWEIKSDMRLVKLSKKEEALQQKENFITIVNPVRDRKLWIDGSTNALSSQIKAIEDKNLSATWLLQYDNLSDNELIDIFKSLNKNQEIGAFLEVSEKWATDAKVSYKFADGDYYRPDKVFLSGYTPNDRQKLIKTYFSKFKTIFKKLPQSVGAWYIDANSQAYLVKFGVRSALTVADQYDTDAASIWGKYWGMPFYPAKFNALEPASNQSNKIPVVNIQWAQRDPISGYGKEIKDSRQSFQANDYISNGFNFSYFENLLSIYLGNQRNDFVQITIGLEAGQEAVRFKEEFDKQLVKTQFLKEQNIIKDVTMGGFADWYQSKYPGISPSHFIFKDDSFWYMSPKFRAAIFKEGSNYILKDLRYYSNTPLRDYLYADKNTYLDRKIPAVIDNLMFWNQISLGSTRKIEFKEKFDRITLKFDNREVQINTNGITIDGKDVAKSSLQDHDLNMNKLTLLTYYNKIMFPIKSLLKIFKYSRIDSTPTFGLSVPDSKLIGFKGYTPGIFSFEFH